MSTARVWLHQTKTTLSYIFLWAVAISRASWDHESKSTDRPITTSTLFMSRSPFSSSPSYSRGGIPVAPVQKRRAEVCLSVRGLRLDDWGLKIWDWQKCTRSECALHRSNAVFSGIILNMTVPRVVLQVHLVLFVGYNVFCHIVGILLQIYDCNLLITRLI